MTTATSTMPAAGDPRAQQRAHTDDGPVQASVERPTTGGSGEGVEVSIGGDLDPSPPRLSVAELQAVLRVARQRAARDAPPPVGVSEDWYTPPIDAHWITVSAAHPGAGATTLALAVAEAAAARELDTHLIELAEPWRSGLVAAADTELGIDADQNWRTGRRAAVTVHRRATIARGRQWPALPDPGGPGHAAPVEVIVDVGSAVSPQQTRCTTSQRWLLVCRVSVPGVQAVEAILAQAQADHPHGGPAVVAAVGSRRWPAAVIAAVGAQLARLRDQGRVVTVSPDHRLAVTGVTTESLPKPLRASGDVLLGLLETAADSAGPAAASDAADRPRARDQVAALAGAQL